MEKFGIKVRALREEKGISREEFCGDETELSVRQLARIESNQSIPSLSKAQFIANQLGVTLGTMTDGDSLELPRRYEELKYLLIRTPTYGDK
ncbi:Helix-turn-helix domain-containing protein, partial [Streptococcus gallolyticus]